jgi:hypothetical protein
MNKYCTFKKEYKEPSKSYNLISTVYFLSENFYKDPNKKYLLGLKKTVQDFYLHFDKSYILRVYYDLSVLQKKHKSDFINKMIDDSKKLINELKTKERIQLIEFSCKNYKKDGLHIGMFPTLVRFSPIFEENKNIKNILISDIEQQSIFDLKVMVEYSKNYPKAKIIWRSHPLVNTFKVQQDWIYASSVLLKQKFDKKILDKFFTEIKDDNSRISKYLEKLKLNQKNFPKFKSFNLDKVGKYTYGVDEAFLNFFLKPEFETKKLPVLYFAKAHNVYRLFSEHYKANKKYMELDKKMNDNLNALFTLIFGNKLINMSKTAKEKYKKINDSLYPFVSLELRKTISKNLEKNLSLIEKNLDKVNLKKESFKSLKIFSKLLDYVVFLPTYAPAKKLLE